MALIFYQHIGELQVQMSEYALKGKVRKWFLTLKTLYRQVAPKIVDAGKHEKNPYLTAFGKIEKALKDNDQDGAYRLLEQTHAKINLAMDKARMLVPSSSHLPPGQALLESGE